MGVCDILSALYENLRIEDEILQYHGAIVRCTAKELHEAKFGAAKVKQLPEFKRCVTVDVHLMRRSRYSSSVLDLVGLKCEVKLQAEHC